MKILLAIKSGLSRSLKAWKGILISWFISLIMVSFIVMPVKASLRAAFGNSMVMEKLVNGINVDVLGDMGINLSAIMASLFSGILMLSLSAILINVFITGGLFDALGKRADRFTAENFFRTSARKFWSFLIISVILYLIVICLIVIIIVVPVSIASNSETAPEGSVYLTLVVSCSLFIAVMSLIFLVADYARAWQAAESHNSCFRALGFGFSQTFRTFFSSLGLMFTMMILQALLGWVMIGLIAGYTPATGGGVFLLFVTSQFLFFIKIFIKAVRYGGVTSLMEQNSNKVQLNRGNASAPDPEILPDFPMELKSETNV